MSISNRSMLREIVIKPFIIICELDYLFHCFLAFTVRFGHPSIDPRSTLNMAFVDSKTIVFHTPPCPVLLTRENPSVSIPIIVTQNEIEIARVDFIYQSCKYLFSF